MRRIMLASCLAATLLAGCNQPQASLPTSEPTSAAASTSAAPDESTIMAAIQATLDDYARAYNRNDLALLQSTVDQSNTPFRRLVEERFTTYQESMFGGGGGWQFSVTAIEERDLGFVLAHIDGSGSQRYGWLFREVDGAWLLSEPTAKQLGETIKLESEHFTYRTYAWADDINPRIMELMEQSYQIVTTRLGREIDFKPTVDIRPIFGITPPQPASALAYYRSGNRPREDRMVIFAPNSFAFGYYDASKGWDGELGETLTHEFTHLINERAFMPVSTMRDWMFEGLAEYVSDSPRASQVSAAVASNQIIPILDTSGSTNPQDLDHLYLLERDVSLAYGLSYAMVAYIDTELGGLEKFWELAETMNKTAGTGVERYDRALQSVFGMSFAEFDAGWRAYLKQNY
ncbi:hypothetical protein [Candidatus Oscillochloris fontis]|uniref:hypothetical protein n=1 Tax=Candidatus Oscillochloris fontis TaxID=2496868 RepID=UPI00101E1EE7|nr:hypothetical protein [Candidatus Oscillochloris fontis]